MNVFYEHDSDQNLIAKKDALEINNWIDHLNQNMIELEKLEKLVKKLPNGGKELSHKLRELNLDCKLQISVFYRYKSSMINIHECEDMECDIYYLNKHEEHRALYQSNVKKSNAIKEDVFAILMAQM